MLTNGDAQTTSDPALLTIIGAFEAALGQKDLEKALALFEFKNPAEREAEELALRSVFSSQEVTLDSDEPSMSADGRTATTLGTLTRISEPRGGVEQWGLRWRRTASGWRIESKQIFDGIDSLVHLALQKRGYVAAGQTIELEDFTLRMIEGTIFLNTEEAGPTALVFVGKGRVTFKPQPKTERGQMKIFAKSEVLEDEVSRAFLRLHPADLYRTLRPGSFVDDPKSTDRFGAATDYFEDHKNDAFILDAQIAGAPWWLLPGLGDAGIVFETKRFGALTLTLSAAETEGVTLFKRRTRRQISAYPRAAGPDPAEGDDLVLDVIHHDLSLSLNPATFDLTGRDTLTMDIRAPLTSFRFHLDDDLRVRSVISAEGGRHLFFRVRGQDSVLVSMGSLAGSLGRVNLTVDYIGRLPAGTVESEAMQGAQDPGLDPMPTVVIDPALIYSTRRAFYPQVGYEDYATSTLKVTVPAEWTVVAGGDKTERLESGARLVTYEQAQDGKYIAFLVSRLIPVARESSGALPFDAYGQSRTRRDALKLVDILKPAVQFYTSLFGPRPYSRLNLALVEDPAPGGHSPPGFLILQQRPALMGGALRDDPATFYDIAGFFLAHELAHQWWGDGVTPRSYRDRWVSEGFAQYAAALWTRESLGEEAFARVLRKMATWARRLSSSGPVNLGNRVGHIQNDAQAHRAVVYNKGALVLDMVRRLIGDDAFRRGLTKLQHDHRFARVDTEMVRTAFESEGSFDLEELWETFVRNTELPTMRIETGDSAQEIVVEGYRGPLPVAVRVGNERLNLVVSSRLKIPGAVPGVKVVLDPDGINLVPVAQ